MFSWLVAAGRHPFQVFGDGLCRLIAFFGIFGHHFVDDPAQQGGQVAADLFERLGLLLEVLDGDADGRFAAEGGRTAEHVIARHSQRIDVGPQVDLAAVDLLGAHVQRRPHRDAVLRQVDPLALLRELGQTEIGHFHLSLAGDHDVFGLDVAMHDAGVVRSLQGRSDLPDDADGEGQSGGPFRARNSRRFIPGTYSWAMY